jgi:hypothetical protein
MKKSKITDNDILKHFGAELIESITTTEVEEESNKATEGMLKELEND